MEPGRLGSAEFAAVELAAVTDVVADACGSLGRFAAPSTAVKRTDVTVVADAATAIVACNCRWAAFASSAPRSHDALPLWLPQPKLNVGFRLAGAATRRMVASGTSPPLAQAVTVHTAVWPRWMLVFAGCTATQRLTCPGSAVELEVNAAALLLVLVAGLPVVADGVALGVAVAVLVLVGVADGLAVVLEVFGVGAGVAVAEGFAVVLEVFGVGVGVEVALAEAFVAVGLDV